MKNRIWFLTVLVLLASAWSVTRAGAGAAVPLTFRVTSLDDTVTSYTPDGACPSPCTLREAITEANNNGAPDTIVFHVGVPAVLMLGSQLPAITDPVTISGTGSALITVDAMATYSSARRIFDLNGVEGTVTISGLTLTGAVYDSSGAAIVVGGDADLIMDDVLVTGNEAFDGSNGGGIFGNTGSTITITDSVIAGNVSDNSGGGIATQGDLTLTNTVVMGNLADSNGGGIYSSGSGTVTVTTSSFSQNMSEVGGGLYVAGTGATLALIASGVDSNTADDSDGGGVFFGGAVLSVIGSTFSNNVAAEDGGAAAIFSAAGAAQLVNTTATGNGAGRYGGGFYVSNSATATAIVHGTISGNTGNQNQDTTGEGGGMYIDMSSGSMPVAIVNTILAGNLLEPATLGAGKGTQLDVDCSGVLVSQGVNLVGDTTGCAGTSEDDIIGEDPMLSGLIPLPRVFFGVLDLLPGSPAIDAADPETCATVDAIGLPRNPAACDIGAVESIISAVLRYSSDEGSGCTMSGTGGTDPISLALLVLTVAGAFAFERRRRRG